VSRVKVVHLTSVHPPYDTRILHKQCLSLAAAGYSVVLIAPHTKDEAYGQVTIKAVRKARSRLERTLISNWTLFLLALRERAKVYHFHDPELIPQGLLLKLFGRAVIYDVHEDLPRQVMNKTWIPKGLRQPIAWIAEGVEYLASRFFDGIVAATPLIQRRFSNRRTVCVQNFPLLQEFPDDNGLTSYCDRREAMVYVGAISRIRGVFEMVHAFQQMAPTTSFRFVMAGQFESDALKREVEALPVWDQIDYLGWQDRQGITELLTSARIGLVVLHPTPNYLESFPVKLFEYMAAGLPVVASDFPVWREIIVHAGCGLLVNPLDPGDIGAAVRKLTENPTLAMEMGQRGRRAVVDRFNWEQESRKLLSLYQAILS